MEINWNDFCIIWFGGLFFANLYEGNHWITALMLLVCAVSFGVRNSDEGGKK